MPIKNKKKKIIPIISCRYLFPFSSQAYQAKQRSVNINSTGLNTNAMNVFIRNERSQPQQMSRDHHFNIKLIDQWKASRIVEKGTRSMCTTLSLKRLKEFHQLFDSDTPIHLSLASFLHSGEVMPYAVGGARYPLEYVDGRTNQFAFLISILFEKSSYRDYYVE